VVSEIPVEDSMKAPVSRNRFLKLCCKGGKNLILLCGTTMREENPEDPSSGYYKESKLFLEKYVPVY